MRKARERRNASQHWRRLTFDHLEERRLLSVTPQLLKDIAPGGATSNAAELVTVGGTLFFSANDGSHGTEPRTLAEASSLTLFVAPDQAAVEGSPLAILNLGQFIAGAEASFLYSIDWGDGTPVDAGLATIDVPGPPILGSFDGAHVYADNGIYTVSVSLDDGDSLASGSLTVLVTNAAPMLSVAPAQRGVAGVPLPIVDIGVFTDAGFANPANLFGELAETFTYSINWGDGTLPDFGLATIDSPGGPGVPTSGSFNGTHTYFQNGIYTVLVTIMDDDGGSATGFVDVTIGSEVAGRYLFYNRSFFDGANSSINTSDDAAIAIDKTAYLPGAGLAVFNNVSSYSRGINGIMIDLTSGGDHAGISLSTLANDFVFKVGNSNTPWSWSLAPVPNAVSVRANFDGSGTDRVVLTWTDGAIENQWLQIQVLPTVRTGLLSQDVFYWGNKIGDTGAPTAWTFATTAASDASFIVSGGLGPAGGITNSRDIDRSDTITDTGDRAAALANIGAIVRIDIGTDGPFARVTAAEVASPERVGVALGLTRTVAPVPGWLPPANAVQRPHRTDLARARWIASFEHVYRADADWRGLSVGRLDELEGLLAALAADQARPGTPRR